MGSVVEDTSRGWEDTSRGPEVSSGGGGSVPEVWIAGSMGSVVEASSTSGAEV